MTELHCFWELIKITNMGSLGSEETLNIVINTDFYNV
jgi:hypothetical protein